MSERVVRFGGFEADFRTGELRKQGVRLALSEQSFRVLTRLLEQPGELVSREDLQKALWGDDVSGDFEHGLNKAVNRLRDVLGDSATHPRFIETLPRRGYRFLATVEAASSTATVPRLTSRARRALLVASMFLSLTAGYWAWWRGTGDREASPHQFKLAVLPFENLNGDPALDFFTDGLTEEMITHLGRLQPQRLAVIARTSAMRYKNSELAVEFIGAALGVDYIVEGSVRHQEDRVRIDARLVSVQEQTQLWAQTYERRIESVFDIQRDIVRRIARALTLELLPREVELVARASTTDPSAYESYLRGRYYWNKRTEADVRRGIEHFELAIARDPGYALAFAGLADCHNLLGVFEHSSPGEAFSQARGAALRALEIEAGLAEAHASMALVLEVLDSDPAGAEREYLRALEINPNYATGHHWYGFFLLERDRHREALREMRWARELDPESPIINADLGYFLGVAGDYSESLEQFEIALALDPGFAETHYRLGLVHQRRGRHDLAAERFLKAIELSGGEDARYLSSLGTSYLALAKPEEARGLLKELRRLTGVRYVPSRYIQVMEEALRDLSSKS